MAESAPVLPPQLQSHGFIVPVNGQESTSLFPQALFPWPATASTAVEGCLKFDKPRWSRVGNVFTVPFFLVLYFFSYCLTYILLYYLSCLVLRMMCIYLSLCVAFCRSAPVV